MKFKRVINSCYIIFTAVCIAAMPKLWTDSGCLTSTPGTARGGQLLLPFVPLIIYIAYKNYKDTPHSKKDFKD